MSLPHRIAALDALAQLAASLRAAVPPVAWEWWEAGRQRVAGGDPTPLEQLFPALVRRLGRAPLVEPDDSARFLVTDRFVVDLAATRRADAGGVLWALAAIGAGADPAFLRTRFDQGDGDERVTVLRALPYLRAAHRSGSRADAMAPLAAVPPVVLDLLREAQRTNTLDHFEAAACDSDLPARCLPQDDFNRTVLKLAFLDLPVWRMLAGLERANTELSRMLQDFATEREAAGRPVWTGTLPFIARAPVEGSRARLIGHLEHGDDAQRLAAAQSVALLRESQLGRYVRERLAREPSATIQTALREALAQLE